MKRFVILTIAFSLSGNVFGWGETGHRVTGKIAERHLTKAAVKGIAALLGVEPLAMSSTWADEMRNDPHYHFLAPYHYATVPIGMGYEQITPPAEGDIIVGLKKFEQMAMDTKLTKEERLLGLRMVVHLVGDLHMPLHVGNDKDRGGNLCMVRWFGKSMNLHTLWDTNMIDDTKLSYTEFTEFLDLKTPGEIEAAQQGDYLSWAQESMNAREGIYPRSVNSVVPVGTLEKPEERTYCAPVPQPGQAVVVIPENLQPSLSYQYGFDQKNLLKERLFKGGVRLAARLNQMFR